MFIDFYWFAIHSHCFLFAIWDFDKWFLKTSKISGRKLPVLKIVSPLIPSLSKYLLACSVKTKLTSLIWSTIFLLSSSGTFWSYDLFPASKWNIGIFNLFAAITERQEFEQSLSGTKRIPSFSEPARLCLLGPPGSGKSHCMHLLRDFFETCLKWTDGVQFQYLAPLNTMAELIGGKTVHSWGCIPANKSAGQSKASSAKEADWNQLFESSEPASCSCSTVVGASI